MVSNPPDSNTSRLRQPSRSKVQFVFVIAIFFFIVCTTQLGMMLYATKYLESSVLGHRKHENGYRIQENEYKKQEMERLLRLSTSKDDKKPEKETIHSTNNIQNSESGAQQIEAEKNGDNNKKEQKMNILFLYGDDWRHDSIGVVNPIVHTPFLDKFASEALMFTQNAVTTSICWISRACLATGQHYARHKTRGLSDPVPFHQYWKDTLFAKLKDNGYLTAIVGKWQPGQIREENFDFTNIYSGFHFQGQNHITDENEKHALHFLQNQRHTADDKPFALFVNFFAPHHLDGSKEQYYPQNKTKSLYEEIVIPFAPTATDEAWRKMPPFFDDINDGRARWRQRFSEPNMAQTMMKNYYRLISGVDMACGKIFEELERQNLMDNTLIIFTTDNGYYHAEHGLADKQYAHQESIRVPLIIKDPRMDKKFIGKKNDDFTLSIDLAPTMLQAGDIDIPDRMQGVDISDLYTTKGIANDKVPWRNSFYYEYPGIEGNTGHQHVQALVKKDFKYIYWPDHDYEELFYLPSDPFEQNDLARNDNFKVILQELQHEFQVAKADAQ